MSNFRKDLLISSLVLATKFLYNSSLSCLTYNGHEMNIFISPTLSEETQNNLASINSFIKQNGKKLFDDMPDPDDVESWKQHFKNNEQFIKPLNQEVIEKFKPTITFRSIKGVEIVEVKPVNWKPNKKILIYIHGGGFTMNSAKTQLLGAVPLATQTGIKTIIIDYERAPIAKHPKILGQVISVITGLLKEGYTMKDMGLYGDSAGGNLVVAAALKMRDDGFELPGALALWSPWLDLTGSGDTYKTLEPQDPILSAQALNNCALAYASLEDHKNPYISPLFGDFSKGMSPTLIQYGTKEMLTSDSTRFATAMRKQGQIVILSPQEGMWHSAPVFSWNLPESEVAIKETAEFFIKHLDI